MIATQTILLAFSGAVVMTCIARVSISQREQRVFKDLATLSARTPHREEDLSGVCANEEPGGMLREAPIALPEHILSSDEKLRIQLFRAGIFSVDGQRRYRVRRACLPLVIGGIFVAFSFALGIQKFWPLIGLGVLLGLQLPRSYLQRRIQKRDEEILFYLPLVIEQVVLGVSSSLDVGPCMKWIVEIADERDSHNPVTELLALAQQYIKLGVATDESLCEVGKLSGNTELKHVFMSLAHVVRHGGEVTKQLQELANAVASQREVKVEAAIKSLEIKATGPVGMILASFMGLFLTSLGIQMLSAFK